MAEATYADQDIEPPAASSDVLAWRELLARYSEVARSLDRALVEKHSLGVSEFEVLDRLVEHGDCVRVQGLAEVVHLTQSALSRVVARLQRDGLVARTMCDIDRRGIYVSLTPLGRERHAAARLTQHAVLAEKL